MLSTNDYRKYTIGVSSENLSIKSFDGVNWIYGDLIIQDQEGIDLIKSKKNNGDKIYISAGYWRDKYSLDSKTAIFKNIVVNHIAIGVYIPRANGASLDSKINKTKTIEVKKEIMTIKKTLLKNNDYSIDSLDIEYDESQENVINSLLLREQKILDAADKNKSEFLKSMDEAEGAKQALEAKIKDLEKKLENSFSKDEFEEYEKVKENAVKHGVTEKFKDIKEGKRLTLEKVYNKSFDEKHIDGAYAVLEADATSEKAKADNKLNDFLEKKNNTSFDSKAKKPLWEVEIGEIVNTLKGA
jgi:hypothetical protein